LSFKEQTITALTQVYDDRGCFPRVKNHRRKRHLKCETKEAKYGKLHETVLLAPNNEHPSVG